MTSLLSQPRKKPLLCRLGRHRWYAAVHTSLGERRTTIRLRCRSCPASKVKVV